MKDIKASLDFRDGEIFGIGKYDLGVSEDATTIEKVKFFLLAYIARHLLSGNASIEITKGRLYVAHDLKPKKFVEQLDSELWEKFHVSHKVG